MVFLVCLYQASFHRKKKTGTNPSFLCKFATVGGIDINIHRYRYIDADYTDDVEIEINRDR